MLSKAQIKYIHSLQNKKYRQKFNQFIAEGDKIVQELLIQKYLAITAIYALPEWIRQHQPAANIPLIPVTERELQQITVLATSNQVLAIVNIPAAQPVHSPEGKISLALETIQDPGNMGTIIRIADWFGISQIYCSADCVDPFHPKTVQASMGSIARVKISSIDLADLLKQHAGINSYAATLSGKDITSFSPMQEGIICIGNESRGLSKEIINACHYQITIPRIGKAESLNAAVATGIICAKLCL